MSNAKEKLTVALLAVSDSTASTLYGMYDLLASVGHDWELLIHGVPGEARIRPLIVAADQQRFQTPSGLWIEPEFTLTACPKPDVIAIPDLLISPDEDFGDRYQREMEWIQRHYTEGATLASACSGALILAEAGLLDGCDATIHWGYCEAMAARYPRVRVHPNRALILTGDEQRLILAGGGSSWNDLTLFLIARFVGVEEAMRVARLHLLDWHHIGQQPFAALTRLRQTEDAVVAKCQEWIAQNYDADSPVAAMVRLSGLAERSFKRRFARATGMSPIEYVHSLRLEESKHMLERSDLPVEAVAHEVGYEDASFFGRLFRRKVGLTPAQYRKRFGAMRQALLQSSTSSSIPQQQTDAHAN